MALPARQRRIGNLVSQVRGSGGYLKNCRDCAETIYLHMGESGRWRVFESWAAGNAGEGEFLPHRCGPPMANGGGARR